ncbi:MAG: cytochrome c [Zoogloeaceae bacterium]|jgi:cytochrome c556|nr:cytochrome c [Zoogloeaceae bacterium]
MPRLFTFALLPALLLSACGGEPEDTRPGQPVAHRRAIFKELLREFEPMGVMLRDNAYDPQRFAAQAEKVKALRDRPWQYFGPDTQYPPSHSKGEVWSKPAEFEAQRQAFLTATDKLLAIAGTEDAKEAEAAFQAVEKSCRDCHQGFKNKY